MLGDVVEFDFASKNFYPLVSYKNLGLDKNSDIAGFFWNGKTWVCSSKTSVENGVEFKYFIWEPPVELTKLNEDNPKITFADIELSNYVFRTYEKSTSLFSADTIIEMQNTSNGKENVYTIEEVAKSVVSNNNVIAVNLGNEVYFVETNAWLIKRYSSSQVIEKIILGDGVAGIIYSDKIEIVNL